MRDPVRGGQVAGAFEELREVRAELHRTHRQLSNARRQVETLEAERQEFLRRIAALTFERDMALEELWKTRTAHETAHGGQDDQ